MAEQEARNTQTASKSEVFAWVLYDWANSAWSTLSIAILVLYIQQVVLPGDAGVRVWAYGIGLSTMVAAVVAPALGALTDVRRNKRTWLAITALGGAAAGIMIALVPEDAGWLVAGLFFSASLGFELAWGLYNGFLPEIATEKTMNRVSAWGFAAGYVGGGVALALAIGFLVSPQLGSVVGVPLADALARDHHQTRDGVFAVDVPPGPCQVRLTLGDPVRARPEMQVLLQGEPRETVSTRAGELVVRQYDVDVAEGPLLVGLQVAAGVKLPAAIAGLEVTGPDGFAVQFDFGTAASKGAPGALWTLADDKYAVRPLSERLTAAVPSASPSGAESKSGAASPSGTFAEPNVAALASRYPAVEADPAAEGPGPRLGYGWQTGQVRGSDGLLAPQLRAGVILMGAWWALFSIPSLLLLRDRGQPAVREPLGDAVVSAFRRVWQTLTHIREYPMAWLFLISFLLFNDGIQTVITQASVFATKELAFGAEDLALLLLMVQFMALPGALAMGWLSDRFGGKPTLIVCLLIWIGLLVAAFFVTTRAQFWVMGAVLSIVMGGAQSVSRAIMGFITPPAKAAEFMGFFNLSGRATSMLGPLLFGEVMVQTGSAHWALVSLLVFFIAGLALLLPVDVARGRREALGPATAS